MLYLLVACAPPAAPPLPLDEAFTEAARAYEVPVDVLAATSYAVSRFQARGGAPDREGGVGVMHLREDGAFPSLDAAAALSGYTRDELAADTTANVMGGAALMRAEADALDTPPVEVEDWAPVVAAWSGAADPRLADAFARHVYDRVGIGFAAKLPEGRVWVQGPTRMPGRTSPLAQAPVARFVPACPDAVTPRDGAPEGILFRHTGGTWASAVDDAAACRTPDVAHFVVRAGDGEVTQMVAESHAGVDPGLFVIDVEGDGTWDSDAATRSAAALARDLCRRYGIPADRAHLFDEADVASAAKSVPAEEFDWDYLIALITGSGSGAPLGDGTLVGSFLAKLHADRYGESDACSGDIAGGALGGEFYAEGSCTLRDHEDAVKDVPVVWVGDVSGGTFDAYMLVDGYDAHFTGAVDTDGSVEASYAGEVDAGGEIGTLSYDVDLEAAGSGAGSVGAGWLGIDANSPIDDAGNPSVTVADPSVIASSGAGWVRVNFRLGPYASPEDPGWIAAYRDIVGGLRGQGLQVYGLIGSESVALPFEDTEAWVDAYVYNFVSIVGRFKDEVRVFESFNEPDNWTDGAPTVPYTTFAQILQDVYLETKFFNGHAEDPSWRDLTIVSGPLFAHEDETGTTSRYLADTIDHGVSSLAWSWVYEQTGSYPYDGVGLHLYEATSTSDRGAVEWALRDELARFQAVMDARDPGKPFWISEIGWPSNNGEDFQADALSAALDTLRGDSRIALVNWFGMVDFSDIKWGVRADMATPKAAWYRLQEEAMEQP